MAHPIDSATPAPCRSCRWDSFYDGHHPPSNQFDNCLTLNPPPPGVATLACCNTLAATKVAPGDSPASGKRGQGARGGGAAAAGGKGGADSAAVDKPPMPMRKNENGKMVVDKEAHKRMFPGGIVLNMKNYEVGAGREHVLRF